MPTATKLAEVTKQNQSDILIFFVHVHKKTASTSSLKNNDKTGLFHGSKISYQVLLQDLGQSLTTLNTAGRLAAEYHDEHRGNLRQSYKL